MNVNWQLVLGFWGVTAPVLVAGVAGIYVQMVLKAKDAELAVKDQHIRNLEQLRPGAILAEFKALNELQTLRLDVLRQEADVLKQEAESQRQHVKILTQMAETQRAETGAKLDRIDTQMSLIRLRIKELLEPEEEEEEEEHTAEARPA